MTTILILKYATFAFALLSLTAYFRAVNPTETTFVTIQKAQKFFGAWSWTFGFLAVGCAVAMTVVNVLAVH